MSEKDNQEKTQQITLTLDAEPEIEQTKTIEEEVQESTILKEESRLTPQERKQVDDFAAKIDISDATAILQYGAAAQNKVADFSDNALKNVKTSDLGDIGDMMTKLVSQLKAFNIDEKNDGFFEKLFKKSSNKVSSMKTKYDDAEANVEKIVKILEDHEVTLLKDIALLDQLYEKNQTNYKELTMYILAGQKRLKEIKEKELPALTNKANESGTAEDAQKVNDLNNSVNRFEKKLHDLELTRMVSLQMAPQIRLVQNNDTLMLEKIQSTLVNTIPLWKSQMLIALGVHHSQEAIKAQNEVTEMTNKMLKDNAKQLHMATVETAEASERGIVDIETLTETNKQLIDTLEDVARIQKEGREKRAAAQQELRKMEIELANKLSTVQNTIQDKAQ